MIIHHMTPEQANEVASIFAKPVEVDGKIEWEQPRWCALLVAAAKDEPHKRRCWNHNIQDHGTETATPQR